MKKYFLAILFLLVVVVFIYYGKNFLEKNIFLENKTTKVNQENQQKNSSLEIMGITINNNETLDITEIYEDNNQIGEIMKPRILVNGFGNKTYIFENNSPTELEKGKLLIYENFDSKNNQKVQIIQDSINGQKSYSYESYPNDWIILE